MVDPSDDERTSAIESMFRIRAVESPPNASGVRTVWHRGLKGAELVSRLDATGHVVRQELWIFLEVASWSAGRFKTGIDESLAWQRSERTLETVRWDEIPAADRLARFSSALKKYQGNDRLIQHLRDVLGAGDEVSDPRISRPIVIEKPQLEVTTREIERSRKPLSWVVIALVVGGVALVVGLILLGFWFGS
jgi:hypothetical protein